ncbi:MAG: VWA domain-containing protein [Acidobacteriota bacterium]|nr:VWA domain-containing protein [Acidobacteriota bacterium]
MAALLLATLALAQDPILRLDVRLIRVLTTVRDASGSLLGTLNKEDFSILDNGAPQSISIFERRTEQPLSVALLVDTSGSTAKDLKYEVDSVARFLNALFTGGNPEDSVALFSFNYQVTKHSGFIRNQHTLEARLRTLRGEAGTALYDAIYLAASELDRRPGRRVMLIVTDGGDTFSAKDYHAALNAAQLADAVIYPVLVVPIAGDAGRNIGGEHALATLAGGTGGRVFEPTLGSALDAAFSDILKELRTQYLLAYYPHETPLTKNHFHNLEVRVNRPGLHVLSRNGYYGESIQ